ncbi:MAG TPA: ATP-binding protein [Polyangiaceae bacterium]|nr:ATP-binding protein [Polyangiaceae bacterium]
MMRLLLVALSSVGLILFVSFIISRLLATRSRGISIRMQMFLALAGVIGTFAAGLGWLVIDRVEARAVLLARHAAEDEARALSGMLSGEMLRSGTDLAGVAEFLKQERAHGAALHFVLLDASENQLFPGRPLKAEQTDAYITVEAPVRVANVDVGKVQVIKPTVLVRQMLADFAPTVLLISLVLGAAAAVSAALLGRAVARPIERLTAFAEQVSEGVRSATVPATSGGREVDRLARSIDSMRRQLEGRPFVETFAADLSHELKNPVAAIRASAEVLEEGALDEPVEARRFVHRIRQASERIERLLGDLLALARIEARGAESLAWVEVDELVSSAVAAQGEHASRISTAPATGWRVRGDATWLARALENLLGNALLHSPAESKVKVSLDRSSESVALRVENQGEVAPRTQSQLFRRFVTTRADRGGTGLGLAIVRAVAEAHGGRVDLESAGPPKVVFRLELPSG